MIKARKNDVLTLIRILAPPFSTNLSVNRCVKQDHKRLQRIENQIKYISCTDWNDSDTHSGNIRFLFKFGEIFNSSTSILTI